MRLSCQDGRGTLPWHRQMLSQEHPTYQLVQPVDLSLRLSLIPSLSLMLRASLLARWSKQPMPVQGSEASPLAETASHLSAAAARSTTPLHPHPHHRCRPTDDCTRRCCQPRHHHHRHRHLRNHSQRLLGAWPKGDCLTTTQQWGPCDQPESRPYPWLSLVGQQMHRWWRQREDQLGLGWGARASWPPWPVKAATTAYAAPRLPRRPSSEP